MVIYLYSRFSISEGEVDLGVKLAPKSSSRYTESKASAHQRVWDQSSTTAADHLKFSANRKHLNAGPDIAEFVYDAKNVLKMEEFLKKRPSKKISKKKSSMKSLRYRFPRIMIIGFGKAGTRALFELLKMRPDLRGPGKEKRFFSDHYDKGLWSYLYSLPDPVEGGVVIEKSPDYIIDEPTPSRIVASAEKLGIKLKDLKFIVILRDPIDRAMSEYLEWNVIRQKDRNKKLPPFHAMVMHQNKTIDDSQPFIKSSNYAKYIRHWFDYFSKAQTCFVDGDRFINSPYSEVHLLEECLGLEPYFTPSHFVHNSERNFYCFKSTVNQTSPYCMNSSKGRRHPDIPAPVLQALQKHFKLLDHELPTLVGRTMEWQESG